MAVPKSVLDARGSWVGSSKLHLSWLPEDQRITESASSLTIESDGNDAFATISYTWEYESAAQFGRMILAGDDSGAASAGWSDSWHQSGGVLALKGDGANPVRVTGHYAAGDGPDWGWRIELESLSDAEFALRMVNITPEGEEEWAVAATYRRA